MREKEREIDLWRRYQRGDERAREELILYYLPLVRSWVSRVSRNATWANREDLAQDGIEGLIRAIERFDPDRGLEFSTFARHHIRGAIFDSAELTRNLPRLQRKNFIRVMRAHDDLGTKLKRKPTIEEIAQEAALSLEQVQNAIDASGIAFPESSNSISLVLRGSLEGFERLQELLKSGKLSRVAGAEVKAIQWTEPQNFGETLLAQELLSTLEPREQHILTEFYWADRSDSELATELKLTLSNVRRIRLRALDKLASRFETK